MHLALQRQLKLHLLPVRIPPDARSRSFGKGQQGVNLEAGERLSWVNIWVELRAIWVWAQISQPAWTSHDAGEVRWDRVSKSSICLSEVFFIKKVYPKRPKLPEALFSYPFLKKLEIKHMHDTHNSCDKKSFFFWRPPDLFDLNLKCCLSGEFFISFFAFMFYLVLIFSDLKWSPWNPWSIGDLPFPYIVCSPSCDFFFAISAHFWPSGGPFWG